MAFCLCSVLLSSLSACDATSLRTSSPCVGAPSRTSGGFETRRRAPRVKLLLSMAVLVLLCAFLSRVVLSSDSAGAAASAPSSGDAAHIPFPVWIPPRSFEPTSLMLLSLGLVSSASFTIYRIRYSAHERSLLQELVHAAVASVFLGLAVGFLLLSWGVYY
ncbi:hypothetical protein BESB_005320 [Besnoitia besnoiti]|uniref:Dolichyl-diphosphooligosaccharide-protein glycosyltransferase subunit OST5 n=1 Tax=Besnoitia besnoiti TaxID=94643 RepID=A0A2A9MNN8_BESBE|nr:hypothetical protein BESB_005320 [Besnoitia besnoiti]PFH38191.1 hypothetical protein BESB_005320 [Besnoitia besnoiti]